MTLLFNAFSAMRLILVLQTGSQMMRAGRVTLSNITIAYGGKKDFLRRHDPGSGHGVVFILIAKIFHKLHPFI